MNFTEIRVKEIPCLSFMKGTRYNLYVGPAPSFLQRGELRKFSQLYNILYLPDHLKNLSKKKLSYNFPGVNFPKRFSVDVIYDTIRKSIGYDISPKAKFFVRYDGEEFVALLGTTDFDHAMQYLIRTGYDFKEVETKTEALLDITTLTNDALPLEFEEDDNRDRSISETIRSSVTPFMGSIFDSVTDDLDEDDEGWVVHTDCDEKLELENELPEPEVEPDLRFRISTPPKEKKGSFKSKIGIPTRELFNAVMEDLDKQESEPNIDHTAEDVKKGIEALLLSGFSKEIIRSWIDEPVKLSRVRITKQMKIILVDYDMEIKMGPLPKTMFIFYLRHPEGVRFTYLQDYGDEFQKIYGMVSVNDDPEKMRMSIDSLINPLKNSYNEKCTAVKKAFLNKVDDDIAKNYYIKGAQGGLKGISLDRNLVEWECKL